MPYFVITSSDGETHVTQLDAAELLKRLKPDSEGDTYWGRSKAMDSIPKSNTNYWPEGSLLIINGEIVVPKPKDFCG